MDKCIFYLAVGGQECVLVTCTVPVVTNVKVISVDTFVHRSSCKDGSQQEDGSVAASCVESASAVSGEVVDTSDSLPVQQ